LGIAPREAETGMPATEVLSRLGQHPGREVGQRDLPTRGNPVEILPPERARAAADLQPGSFSSKGVR
jgi:hypothetical protein